MLFRSLLLLSSASLAACGGGNTATQTDRASEVRPEMMTPAPAKDESVEAIDNGDESAPAGEAEVSSEAEPASSPARETIIEFGTLKLAGPHKEAAVRAMLTEKREAFLPCYHASMAGKNGYDEISTIEMEVSASGAVSDPYASGSMETSDCINKLLPTFTMPRAKKGSKVGFRVLFFTKGHRPEGGTFKLKKPF